MSEENQLQGLRAYAAMMNTLDADRLEPFLAEDFVYESQMVFEPLTTKQAFMEYIRPKLQTVKRSNATVYAELGSVTAYGRQQPCVVLAQNSRDNLVGLVLAKSDGRLLKRLDLCIVPPPNSAERTGEYPQ